MQPPGRAMRSKEASVTSAPELAAQLLPIVASRLVETPYMVCSSGAPKSMTGRDHHECHILAGYISRHGHQGLVTSTAEDHHRAALWLQVVAHSVGTWIAYELLRLARSRGLPMPRKAFLSAMASPDIADAARPWRRQRMLTDAQFQVTCAGLTGTADSCTAPHTSLHAAVAVAAHSLAPCK